MILDTFLKERCACDLRHRAWNPNTGRCETCGRSFEDHRSRKREEHAS